MLYDIIYGMIGKLKVCCNLGLTRLAVAAALFGVLGPVEQHLPAWSDSQTMVQFQDFPCARPPSARVNTDILYWHAHNHRASSKKKKQKKTPQTFKLARLKEFGVSSLHIN